MADIARAERREYVAQTPLALTKYLKEEQNKSKGPFIDYSLMKQEKKEREKKMHMKAARFE